MVKFAATTSAPRRFSWMTLRALGSSVNDALSRVAPGYVDDLREQWVARAAPSALPDDLVREVKAKSFILVGDPGEQDESQRVVADGIRSHLDGVDFIVICSDVIYPAGDVNDYIEGFYKPYGDFGTHMYAIPGNHDWYDSLFGFMWIFSDGSDDDRARLEKARVPRSRTSTYRALPRLAKRLWLRPSSARTDVKNRRNCNAPPVGQPGPYFALDLGRVLVVCIDTGISGSIDVRQGEWLVDLSRRWKGPKILVTGKPLLVNRKIERCEIDGNVIGDVLSLVRTEEYQYVAVIGGDVHNYQHYIDGNVHHFVSGGGGAYLSATHAIPATTENFPGDVDLWPTREESLALFTERLVPTAWRLVRSLILWVLGSTAAVVAFATGYPEKQLATTLVSSSLLLALLLTILVVDGRDETVRNGVIAASAFVGGATLGLAGWWLAPDHFTTNALAVGAIAGGALVVSFLVKISAWWRPVKQPAGWGSIALLVTLTLGGLVGFLWLCAAEHGHYAAALACIVGPGAAGGFLRLKFKTGWTVWVLLLLAAAAQLVAAVLVLYAWPVRAAGAERWFVAVGETLVVIAVTLCALVAVSRSVRLPQFLVIGGLIVAGAGYLLWCVGNRAGSLPVIAAIVAVPTPALLAWWANFLRRRTRDRGFQWLFLGTVILLVGTVACVSRWSGNGDQVGNAAIAAAVILTLALLIVAIAHVTFIGALSLVWPPRRTNATLKPDEAKLAIQWRDQLEQGKRPTKVPHRRVKSLVNIVHPGSKRPHGPIHQFVAEICDNDEPPFYKHFLRLDLTDDTLTTRCYRSTTTGGATTFASADPVVIPLPPRP